MFHIPQPGANDCGIATAAMVGEASYQEARSLYFKLSLADQTLDAGQMRRLLEAITQIKWRIGWTCWSQDVSQFRLLDGPLALLLQGDEYHHWIASKRSIVHDPAFPGAFTLDQYPRKHWKVFAFLKPVDAALLDAYRARRRQMVVEQLATDLPIGKECAKL